MIGMILRGYIDLHMHLDGSLSADIVKELARLQGIALPADEAELERRIKVPADCESLNDFLKCFAFPLSLLQTKLGLSEAVRLVAERVRSQGVVYGEIRFAPQLHTQKGMTQEDAVLAALEGLRKTNLKCNLILCCMRGEGNEKENEETLRLAKKYLVEDGGVVAIDLAGAEALFPTAKYRELFAKAKEWKVPFTIHAGEADGPESVRLAVEYGAKRIGHGVRSFEDPELLEVLKQEEVTLEICPTSNRMTRAVEHMEAYPFMDYLQAGLKVTINTDDMGIEGITLEHEFNLMESVYGFSKEQARRVLGYAVDAAFTTRQVKEELRENLGLEQ